MPGPHKGVSTQCTTQQQWQNQDTNPLTEINRPGTD